MENEVTLSCDEDLPMKPNQTTNEDLESSSISESSINDDSDLCDDDDFEFLKFEDFTKIIRECLSILRTAKENSPTNCELLNVIYTFWDLYQTELRKVEFQEPFQLILDSLKHFADQNEEWKILKEDIKEGDKVDTDKHGATIKALGVVAKLENKIYPQFGEKSNAKVNEEGRYLVANRGDYQSTFVLTSRIHFYETVVLTDEEVTAGWGTRIWKGGNLEFVNEKKLIIQNINTIDDEHFIGINGTFPIGTVLGCLMDVPKKTFAFFVNGRQVQLTKKIALSSNAYYVHIQMLMPYGYFPSLLYFNFGQAPFKYPPIQFDIGNPFEASRYSLYEEYDSKPLFDNRAEPWFKDEKQRTVKKTIVKLLKDGVMTKEKILEEYRQLWENVTFHKETYALRWWQAIIEMENIDEGQVNAWASLVEGIVKVTFEEWDYKMERFLEPYSKLQVTANGDPLMYRNLAILFATNIQYIDRFYYVLHDLFTFLFSAFLATNDLITAMFALIGLQTIYEKEKNKPEKTEIFESETFKNKLQKWNENVQKKENFTYISDFSTQLKLILHNFEHSLTSSPSLPLATPTSLSPSDCSPLVKFSSDLLSLRSDFQWKSARSHLSIDVLQERHSLASPRFFFEVTLHTSGSMRIGWATGRLQLSREEVGSNEFSIGYDGHCRSIWHQGVKLKVKNVRQWKEGDVIGCLIDFASKQFTFYQNGTEIETNGDIYSAVSKEIKICNKPMVHTVYEKNDSIKSFSTFFSEHPYHAALSLDTYQQVAVNFGHTFFCHAPKCLDIWDFQQYSDYLEIHGLGPNKRFKSNQVTITQANITNGVLAVDSTMTTGNVSISHASVATPSEPSFSIEERTVCDVCKEETDSTLRQLVGCAHLKFCRPCAAKKIKCDICKR